MEVFVRLAIAAVLVVAPSLLFLGFWRALQHMQDDELVARVQWRMLEEGTWAPAEPLTRRDLDPELDAPIAARAPARPPEE